MSTAVIEQTAIRLTREGTIPYVNPWVVALTVTLATFMELLDTSIANVSLPYIAGGLGRSCADLWSLQSTGKACLVASSHITFPGLGHVKANG